MTDPAPRPLPAEPDFEALGRRFAEIMSEIIHRPERSWYAARAGSTPEKES